MQQMIEMQIIPAKLEYRKTEAQIEYVNAKAKSQVSRQEGGLQVQTKQAKVYVDSYQCRRSLGPGFQSVADSIKAYADKGLADANAATAKYASRGIQQMKAPLGHSMIPEFAKQDTFKDVNMNIGIDFLPRVAPEVSVEPGSIDISFTPDQLDFDWSMSKQQLKFTPGKIETEMVQRPDVIVRYVGGPMYVPKSSDPSYSG